VLAGSSAAGAAARPDGTGARPGPAAGVISTVAGGVGGPAKATRVWLNAPCGVSFNNGFAYVGDGVSMRRINPATDWLTTLAGTGVSGPLGDGHAAVRASLDNACWEAVDHSGNLVFVDTGHQRVQVVAASTGTFYGQAMTAGDIYTVAGSGAFGFSGDGGPATGAELANPVGVAPDASGNLLIADQRNGRVRVVAGTSGTYYGRPMTAGDIYTIAGTGVAGYSGDGGAATSAELNQPADLAVTAAGNVVIAYSLTYRIRMVTD
jgi:trimeric autotransporter adhesin